MTVARATRRLRTLPAMHLLRRIVVGVPLLAGAAFVMNAPLAEARPAAQLIPTPTFLSRCAIDPSLCATTTTAVPPVITISPSLILPSFSLLTTTTTTPETTTTSTTTSTTLPRAQTNRLNRTGATLPDGSPDPADITADDGGLPIVVPIAAGAVLAAGAAAAVLVVRSRRA